MSFQDILLRLLSVAMLIAINAFFVTAEFSIVSVRRSRISQLVEAGDVQAQTVQSLQRSLDRLLSTTQLGITLSSLALGWIGENTMAVLVKTLLINLPLPLEISRIISHSFAIPIAFFLLVYLQIVLGELCPKSVALIYSEQLARFLGPSLSAIARLFKPFIWVLNQSTRFLLRLGGIEYTGSAWYNQLTPEELRLIISTEIESSALEANQREILDNVFQFGDVQAAEIMVNRTKLSYMPINATLKTIINEVASTGYSRYPVIGDSLDDIRGLIDFKDLALPLAKGNLSPDTPITPWIKPVRFVPESTVLSELLLLMQRSHLKMVMLVDEFGGTSGLVTLQDVIAEIISYENQSDDSEEFTLQILDQHTYLVQAQMKVEELNELLNLDIPLIDEYQTIGGFVLYEFQKIPNQGESIDYGNLQLTVEKASGPRLYQIRITRKDSFHNRNNQVKIDPNTDTTPDSEEKGKV